jgi:hypothetical protein
LCGTGTRKTSFSIKTIAWKAIFPSISFQLKIDQFDFPLFACNISVNTRRARRPWIYE